MTDLITKILGLVLLLVGIAIIGWALYSSYNIFTGQTPVPELFKITEKTLPKDKGGTLDIQTQMEEMLQEQIRGLLPADTVPKILNLIAWSMLAGLLILGGGQISGLGIKLIKGR